MDFNELPLLPRLRQNVAASGYTTPTPIQRAAIPLVLDGHDLLGCAQTGTGKTAAFALPILQHLALAPTGGPRMPRALILTPTRELALQIGEQFECFGKGLPVRSAVVFGGVSQVPQVEALQRGIDVLVACPGRLWDLMNQGYVTLDKLEIFVLDEADRMLDMGFIHDVKRIVAKLPAHRQTLLFSATMPPEVEELAMTLLRNPESVKVDPVSTPVEAIDQKLFYVDKVNKKHLLAKLLSRPEVENCLVFSKTKHGADRIVRELKRAGIDADAIHGDKSQGARQRALMRFKNGESRVLVATDIAARGLDIVGLSHVINYDQPMEPEAYIHRIGRTGRAGRTGVAWSFCCVDELKQLNQVEKLIGKRLPAQDHEWPMEITTPTEPQLRSSRSERVTKVNRRGEAVQTKSHDRTSPNQSRKPASEPQPQKTPAKSMGAQRITIGGGGRVQKSTESRRSMPAPVRRVNNARGGR